MKRIYIKPYTEAIIVQTEALLQTIGSPNPTGDKITLEKDPESYEPGFTVGGTEESNDGYGFSKPSDPNLWDDEEW